MTIIDKYISNNSRRSVTRIANELGVTEGFVRMRQSVLNDRKPVASVTDLEQEIVALQALIDQRGSGWAVEVAGQRIEKLKELIKIKQ